VIKNLIRINIELFQVEFLNTLVVVEITTGELLIAYLTHNQDLRTILLNMIIQLPSSHHLCILPVAYITPKFRAMELSMSLKFTKGLPNDFVGAGAFVGELAEIYAVLDNFVNWSQEITTALAVWAADIVVRSIELLALRLRFAT